jgi:nucleotide-binding universal stress UspA family protein
VSEFGPGEEADAFGGSDASGGPGGAGPAYQAGSAGSSGEPGPAGAVGRPDLGGPGPVVVGYDGGPSGEDALALAGWLAGELRVPAMVAVVHPSAAAISPARVDAEWVADRHRYAEQVVAGARALLAGRDGAGEQVQYRVVASSSAAHGLHDLAEELAAAVIVVGSASKGAEQRVFAGSTADRLLHGSACPAAIAPAGLRHRRLGALTRIGVGYIDTAEARTALAVAAEFALRTSAALRLFTVVAEEAEVMPLFIGRDAEQAFSATAREAYQFALDTARAGTPSGLQSSGELLVGAVVDVLAEIDQEDVDLLFCGSRGYGPVRRALLGGVSARLVRRARSPLVVVPGATDRTPYNLTLTASQPARTAASSRLLAP